MRRNATSTLRTTRGQDGGFTPLVTATLGPDPAQVRAAAAVLVVAGCRVLGLDPREPANCEQVAQMRAEMMEILGEGAA